MAGNVTLDPSAVDVFEDAIDGKLSGLSYSKPSNYAAKVLDIDETGTVWVNLLGGVERTPVEATSASVGKGDTVNVRIENNRAFIDGNVSDPSASSSSVVRVSNVASKAREDAIAAIGYSEQAQEAAAVANIAAEAATRDAARANTAAEQAQQSADTARSSADKANFALSDVERVVGTLNWIAEHGRYEPTTDVEVDDSKVYYTRTGSGTQADPYVYSVVSEPKDSDLGSYFILTIDESVQNYIASHLWLDDYGLNLTVDSASNMRIHQGTFDGDHPLGLYLVDIEGNIIGRFSDSAMLGVESSGHTVIDENGLVVYNGDDRVMFAGNDADMSGIMLGRADGVYLPSFQPTGYVAYPLESSGSWRQMWFKVAYDPDTGFEHVSFRRSTDPETAWRYYGAYDPSAETFTWMDGSHSPAVQNNVRRVYTETLQGEDCHWTYSLLNALSPSAPLVYAYGGVLARRVTGALLSIFTAEVSQVAKNVIEFGTGKVDQSRENSDYIKFVSGEYNPVTIYPDGITVNGLINGVNISSIGYFLEESGSATVPDSTNTNVVSIDLTAGTWIVLGFAGFGGSATGTRAIKLSTTSGETGSVLSTVSHPPLASGRTRLHTARIFDLDDDSTVYLVGYQTSGGSSSVNGDIQAMLVTTGDPDSGGGGGGGGGGTDDYTLLRNKPSIEGVTLVGDKTFTGLGLTAGSNVVISDVEGAATVSVDEMTAAQASALLT